ncbi:MAG: response regulator [Pseudomonadota bacterium]
MPAGRVCIGIVDDEPLIASLLKDMLEGAGYTVSAVVHTYDAAMTLVEQPDSCEIVFVDLALGGKPTGIDVARRAVANGLAVVIMTGGASLPADLDGVGLLLKPFSVEQVRTLLHSLPKRDGKTSPAR